MSDEKTKQNVQEAIANAKAEQRKKMQSVDKEKAKDSGSSAKVSPEEKAERAKKLAEEREAKKQERERVRAQKKAEREALQAQKKKEREAKKIAKELERKAKLANRPPAHMSKVEKAAAKLPELNEELAEHVANLTENYNVAELSRLVAHLQHSNRARSTLASADVEFEVGQRVRIVASENDPSLIDQVGTVTEMRKIRVLLEVEGVNRPVYLFASDCEALETVEASTSTDEDDESDAEGVTEDEEGFLHIEEKTGTDE